MYPFFLACSLLWLVDGRHSLVDENGRQVEEEPPSPPVWQTVTVGLSILIMLGVIVTDKIGADFVLLTTLIFFMVTEIITVKEGLVGFSNTGVLTVMALFVVAEGVSRTGSLDYYMGKMLGKPKTIAGAQIRLMVPIAILSAFMNNTPIVAVMIPLVIRWAKTMRLPVQQLLIPLSFATILGGTCTLVGTSTNLVVSGLLQLDYPDEEAGNIGLFDLGMYGVPNLLFGLAYIMALGPWLLPQGKGTSTTISKTDELLLGARVTQWSPAAGRTVRRSGLGNSGGIYLVNVRRAATGNVQYGVSKDFVLSVGDELYFTGDISGFSDFCEKHALEIIAAEGASCDTAPSYHDARNDVGTTLESITQGDSAVLLQAFNLLSDQIAGREPVESGLKPTRVIIAGEASSEEDRAELIAIDCPDRNGLLMDITQTLFQHGLKMRTSEAQVIDERSLSVWRCEAIDPSTVPDREEVWSALSELLHLSKEVAVTRKSGIRVVRATVPRSSDLIGRKPAEVKFGEVYKAGIVAYQKKGRNASIQQELAEGDLLVLEILEGSPLLVKPPENFYETKGQHVTSTEDIEDTLGTARAWRNLKVEFEDDRIGNDDAPKGEFLVALVVPPKSPFVGKSMNELGYSSMPGIVLVGMERPLGPVDGAGTNVQNSTDNAMQSLSPDDKLREGDILWMSGAAEAIADLQKLHGIRFYHNEEMEKATACLQDRRMVQAVIARGSPLIGTTVAQAHFRTEYGGAVIAIQRGCDRVHEHPGRVKLQMGDALLIQAGPEFYEKQSSNYRTFALVSEVENSAPPRPRLFLLCVVLIITSLIVASLEIRDLLVTASIVGIVMVSLGVVTQQEARDSIHWDLYVVIASAFGIGSAMEASGFASLVATGIVSVGDAIGLGDAGMYGSVYLATSLLSSILTNNAAAALMYPIAMDAVVQTGANRLKMAIAVMLAASDYMTSFGYQTNLMVFAAGGYRNIDFLKFGTPLQILLWLTSTALLAVPAKNWYIGWIVSVLCFLFVASVRLVTSSTCIPFSKPSQEDKERHEVE